MQHGASIQCLVAVLESGKRAMPSIVRDRHCPLRKCLFSAVASVAFLLALVGATQAPGKEPAYRPDKCIFGDKHKSTPSPEGTKANYRYWQSNKSTKYIAPDIIIRTTMELAWQVAHTHILYMPAHAYVLLYMFLLLQHGHAQMIALRPAISGKKEPAALQSSLSS